MFAGELSYQVSIFHPSGTPCALVTSQVAFLLLMNVPEAATPLSQSFVVSSDGLVVNNALTYRSLLQSLNIS